MLPTPKRPRKLLAEEVLSGRCPLKNWDDAVEQWFVRLACLRELDVRSSSCPRRMTRRSGLSSARICHGSLHLQGDQGRGSHARVARLAQSPQAQRWLDQFAPERLELPGGRKAKVIYTLDSPPMTAARIQDLYGVTSLTVAKGRQPVTIQILAPNQRPVQITTDLANFWKESYPKIKQELSRKYPKHEWR